MKAQVIRTDYTEYTGLFPVQPWRHLPAVSQGSAMEDGATTGSAASAASTATAAVADETAAAPRKASDRGASAVEWVVITGIVVAIVAGVGWGISKAISNKADDACNKIATAGNADPGGGNGGNTGGGTTGGSGCAK